MTDQKKEWLAWINIGSTGSSWSRYPTKSGAIQLAVNLVKDWAKLYDVWDKEVVVHVTEVTGYGDLVWDYEGVYGVPDGAEDDKYVKIERPIEHEKRKTAPKPAVKKRRLAAGWGGEGNEFKR
jgi:hypothetical protein